MMVHADLDGGDSGGIQLGAILHCLGSEQWDEVIKGQKHIVPLPSLSVKAPIHQQIV